MIIMATMMMMTMMAMTIIIIIITITINIGFPTWVVKRRTNNSSTLPPLRPKRVRVVETELIMMMVIMICSFLYDVYLFLAFYRCLARAVSARRGRWRLRESPSLAAYPVRSVRRQVKARSFSFRARVKPEGKSNARANINKATSKAQTAPSHIAGAICTKKHNLICT